MVTDGDLDRLRVELATCAAALEPGKIYLLLIKKGTVSDTQLHGLMQYFGSAGIKLCAVRVEDPAHLRFATLDAQAIADLREALATTASRSEPQG